MRLFFALWPAPAVVDALAGIAREAAGVLGGKATRAETIHLTLAFLGEQPAGRLPGIIAAAQRVPMTPVDMIIDRLAVWRHNHLLWAGCEAVPESLLDLVSRLQDALRQAEIPFDVTHPVFVPHLTLVRRLSDRAKAAELPAIAPLSWRSERLLLMESRLSNEGPSYRIVAEFPMA